MHTSSGVPESTAVARTGSSVVLFYLLVNVWACDAGEDKR